MRLYHLINDTRHESKYLTLINSSFLEVCHAQTNIYNGSLTVWLREVKNMDGATWFMLGVYIIGIGGIAIWTLVHSLRIKDNWND